MISVSGLNCAGTPPMTVTAVKFWAGRVNHQRFDFFPHVELVGAIASIDVLHLQVGERGVESQFDGIGQTRTHIREDGSMKHRTHLRIPTAHPLL